METAAKTNPRNMAPQSPMKILAGCQLCRRKPRVLPRSATETIAINSFPSKNSPDNLLNKKEDDFAARMYVIFPALFFSNSKVLEYIWAEDIEIGTVVSSPYSDNIKLIVVERGLMNENDGWITEERDIYKDYVWAFDSKPRLKMGAIAFMCDSDSTKSNAEAFFDEIKIFYKK